MSEPAREPTLEPPSYVHVVLQDHGPDDLGWGTAAWGIAGDQPRPLVYTGTSPGAIKWLHDVAEILHQATGKPTILARYEKRVDIVSYPKEG